jgi:hypothetical protein
MSKKLESNRREFLEATAKAGIGLAALYEVGLIDPPHPSEAHPLSQSSTGSNVKPKGNWPQEYTVQRDDEKGLLIFSTPYYSVEHDLKKGGAISRISYTHGQAPNLLIHPVATSIALAAKKVPYSPSARTRGQQPQTLSDLHDSSPAVSSTKTGKFATVNVEAALRTSDGRDVGVRTKTTYQYRWGYIKIHKEVIFPKEAVETAALTVLNTTLHPSLTHYGLRPGAFGATHNNPFGIEPLQWGLMRPGEYLDQPLETRYFPCHMVFANPGVEGMEWFSGDNLGQWYYPITETPGTGHLSINSRNEPLGIQVTLSPLDLPNSPELARGGSVSLSSSYAFDYYLGMSILEGHAYRRWLESSFGPNGGKWVSDEEIRRKAEAGIITMTLHNDGDSHHDGLYWRDGTYPPYPPEQMKNMEHVIATCQQNGIKVLPYFSNHELNMSTDTFKKHGQEWGRKADDQGNISPGYFYGAQMCFKSGWKDFFKNYVDTVLKNQPFDGIYYDWNMALYCDDPKHMGKQSNGVSGAKGLGAFAFSPTSHWDVDEWLEMMEWTRERVGPDRLVTLHTTGVPMIAAENFADFVCTLEWGYGKLIDGIPKPDQLPLEWNFAGARSRAIIEYGTLETSASQRVKRLFALTTLLTGTAPWPLSDEAAELFKTLKPLGDVERFHFEDRHNQAVKLDGNDLLSAVYSRPEETYILLANFQPTSREVNCIINPGLLKHPLTSVQSAKLVEGGSGENLDAGRLTGGGERISLPGDGVRLLHLQS